MKAFSVQSPKGKEVTVERIESNLWRVRIGSLEFRAFHTTYNWWTIYGVNCRFRITRETFALVRDTAYEFCNA